jgi:hypothetical protein
MFCSKCRAEIATFKFCPECGTRAEVRGRRAPSSRLVYVFVFPLLFLAICSLVFLAFDMFSSTEEKPASPVTARIESVGTGNKANDVMLSLSEHDQALALGRTAGCVGNRAFYMGISPKEHDAYWSVGCSNGTDYQVQIAADSSGSTRIVECSTLRAVGIRCFERVGGQ